MTIDYKFGIDRQYVRNGILWFGTTDQEKIATITDRFRLKFVWMWRNAINISDINISDGWSSKFLLELKRERFQQEFIKPLRIPLFQ